MNFFEVLENAIYFRNEGELLRIRPWGANSLRVEASMMDQIPEGEIALMEAEIDLNSVQTLQEDERHASICNGNIRADLCVQEWGNGLMITFRNKRGEILLQEVTNGGALTRKARKFRPLQGDFRHGTRRIKFPSYRTYLPYRTQARSL